MLRKQLTTLSQLLTYYQSKQVALPHGVFSQTVRDTHLYHEFIPHCSQSHIVTQLSPLQNYTRLTISFGNFKQISYLSHVVIEESEGSTRVTSICKDEPLKYLKSVWQIEEKGSQSSQVTYSIDFEFDSMIYQLASSAFMGVMGKAMWDVFMARATQLAHQPTKQEVNPSPTQAAPYEDNKPSVQQQTAQNLSTFLAQHPDIAHIYKTNPKMRIQIDCLANRLQGRPNFSPKLLFQIRNLLTHLQ